jgi:flagellar basal body rod protein FlgF
MALTVKIDKFYNDTEDNTKKMVGLEVVNEKGYVFIVDKKITIVDGKSDESYVKDAYDASLAEINEWESQLSMQGKVFNPSDSSLSE